MVALLAKAGLLSLASSALASPLVRRQYGYRHGRHSAAAAAAEVQTDTVYETTTTYTTLWVSPTDAPDAPAAQPPAAEAPASSVTVPAPAAPKVSAPAASILPADTTIFAPSVAPSPGVFAQAAASSAAPAPAPAVAAPAGVDNAKPKAPAPAATTSIPAAAPATSAPASSGSSGSTGGELATSGSTSSSGGKAGVAYNDASVVKNFVGKGDVGWAYNWNAKPGSIASGIQYIPTLWGLKSDFTNSWVSDATKAISNGATAVMGFNEPDHSQQANLDAATAASGYKQYITTPFAGKVKLVSPSVTNGGAPMGLTYLSNFMSACSECQIDAINLHWYDSSSNIDYFKSYISGAYAQFKKPIWLTEFGTTDGNDQAFLEAAKPWLDSQAYVEKYAYFMAESGKLLTGSGLSAAGVTYSS